MDVDEGIKLLYEMLACSDKFSTVIGFYPMIFIFALFSAKREKLAWLKKIVKINVYFYMLAVLVGLCLDIGLGLQVGTVIIVYKILIGLIALSASSLSLPYFFYCIKKIREERLKEKYLLR